MLRFYIKTILILFPFFASSQLGEQFEISKTSGDRQNEYADLNNDGFLDLITVGDFDLSYYLGDGNNNFGMKQFIQDSLGWDQNPGSTRFQLDDLDNDGDLDFTVTISNNSRVSLYFNENMQFRRESIENLEPGLLMSITLDLNNDGLLDIITSHIYDPPGPAIDRYMNVHYNEGNGNFGPEIRAKSGSISDNFKKADMDNDGTIDLVFRVPDQNMTSTDYFGVIYNVGGVLTGSVNYFLANNGLGDFEIHDVDSDGILDVIAPFEYSTTSLIWWKNTGTHQFNYQIVTVPARPTIRALKVSDVDQDGTKDLILAGSSQIIWYKIQGGTFIYQNVLTTSVYDVFFIDHVNLNQDAFLDLVVSQDIFYSETKHFLNNGLNAFPSSKSITYSARQHERLRLADFDGDGLVDVMYSSNYGKDIMWQKNLGNNSYSEEIILHRVTFDLTAYEIGDLDNDNDVDLVFSCNCSINSVSYTGGLFVQYNDGLGNFGIPVNIGSFAAADIHIDDMDNDGDKDLVVASVSSGGYYKLAWYSNNTGSYTYNLIVNETVSKEYIETGDFNGDGTKDILTKNNTNLKIRWNVGNTFTTNSVISTRVFDFKTGDFDQDGDIDIAKSHFFTVAPVVSHYVRILKNNGAGVFSDSVELDYVPSDNANYRRLLQFDYDLDGDLDIFHLANNILDYQENLGGGNFAPKIALHSTIGNISDIRLADMNLDGELEIVLTNSGQYRVEHFKQVYTGNSPTLTLSSATICPGEQFQITVGNPLELNDNTTWSLFEDSCGGTLIQSSASGVFTLSTNSEQTYYVAATGGINYTGSCAAISVVLTGSLEAPTLTAQSISSDSLLFNWTSNSPAATGWEYSLNDGASWISLALSTDSLLLSGLNPNVTISFMVRALGSGGVCLLNEIAEAEISTLCYVHQVNDTVYACGGETFIYPDGSFEFYVGAAQSHISVLTSQYGCDSLVTTVLYSYPPAGNNITDTVCYLDSYTYGDGTTVNNLTNYQSYYCILTSVNGCDSAIYYSIYVRPQSLSYVYEDVCSSDSYTFPDGFTMSNITSNVNYPVILSNMHGCDSTVNFNIMVVSALPVYDTVIVCQADSYTFDDGYFEAYVNSPFTYTYTIDYPGTCDTTYYIYVDVLERSFHYFEATICTGQSYLFGSQTLTAEDYYTETFTAANGCDSIVDMYLWVLNQPAPTISVSTIISSEDCQTYYGSAVLSGSGSGDLYLSGTIDDTIYGITFPYTVDSLIVGSYSIVFQGATCPSNPLVVSIVDSLSLLVAVPIAPQCTGDTIDLNFMVPQGGTYQVDGTNVFNEFIPDSIQIGSHVLSYILQTAYCVDTVFIPFEVIDCSPSSIIEQEDFSKIQAYPNPSNGKIIVSGVSELNGLQIDLYDAMGRKIQSYSSSELDLGQLADGVYTLFIHSTELSVIRKVQLIK